jgi:hypothetical protein
MPLVNAAAVPLNNSIYAAAMSLRRNEPNNVRKAATPLSGHAAVYQAAMPL